MSTPNLPYEYLAIALAGCLGIFTAAASGQSVTSPVINQPLAPASAPPGDPDFKLTLKGSGFVQGSLVNWNGNARVTQFVSASQLTATILAADIAVPGTAFVTVVNPGPPGSEVSNTVFFGTSTPAASVAVAMRTM